MLIYLLVNWCLISGLEGVLNGSDVGNLSDGLLSRSVESALSYAWSGGHETAVQTSNTGQREWICSSLLASTAMPVSSMMPASCLPATATIPGPSRCQSVALSSPLSSGSSTGVNQHISRTCRVELQPAETSAVESSRGDARRRQTHTALELGNVHLRDLLSQDDDDDDNDAEPVVNSSAAHRGDNSPQEPQSTSSDDPPDSSTGNVCSSATSSSILKQLLTDSDTEEQNEVSCEPQTTHTDNEPHVLLKVC